MAKRFLIFAFFVLTALYLLSVFLSAQWWIADLLTNFQVYFLAGFVFLLIVFSLLRLTRLAGISTVLAAIIIFRLTGYWLGTSDPCIEENSIRIVSLNLLSSNSRFSEVTQFVRESEADVVFLMEVTPAWEEMIKGWAALYPYQTSHNRLDNFGIALLSKKPPKKADIIHAGLANLPTIVAEFESETGSFVFIGTHPLPPVSSNTWALRNDQFKAVNGLIRSSKIPVVLAGDFNSDSFSSNFNLLTEGTTLRDSRKGEGLQPTWHAGIPFLEVALDHVLVTEEICIQKRFTGQDIGSDHRPVVLDFALSN